jgi:hypothetical protein
MQSEGESSYPCPGWQITYQKKSRTYLIETTDYHADPLRLSLEDLGLMLTRAGASENVTITKKSEPAEKSDHVYRGATREETSKEISIPTDYVKLMDRDGYDIGISKKEKSLCIQPSGEHRGLVKISRKELAKIGKSMNKRARRREGVSSNEGVGNSRNP